MTCCILQFISVIWMQDCCSVPILIFVIGFTNITLVKDVIPETEEAARNICIAFQVIIPVLVVLAALQYYYVSQRSKMNHRASIAARV